MNPIENILKNFPVIILDGALATELERRGYNIDDPLWSAKILSENPKIIEDVHYDYFVSGADCAITSSYQATMDGFIQKGFKKNEATELIKLSVRIAKKARDKFWKNPSNRVNRPKPLIAGSIGPYGSYLADGSEYVGNYNISEQELIEFHRPRMELLIEEKVDILACETIPSLVEAKAILKLLEEFPSIYAWMSFSAKDKLNISDGTSIAECSKFLSSYSKIAALGVNCTKPKYINSLIKQILKNCTKPIIVYPNSGEEYNTVTKEWCGNSSIKTFSCSAKSWFENGAKLIGGCCRTTPEYIKSIQKILKDNF